MSMFANIGVSYSCCSMVIIFTSLVPVFSVQYKFINNALSWNQTVSYCKTRENGTLVNMSDLNMTDVPTDVWINRFQTLSDWIWSEGCYLTTFLTPDVESYDLNSTININTCRHKCNTDYLGLRGTTCYCIKTLPRDNTKSSNCDKPCNKDMVDYCGNKNEDKKDDDKVSIYKIERNTSNIKFLPEEGATSCAGYKIIDGSVLLEQIRCTNNMHVVCESYIGGKTRLIKLNDVQNWTESLKTCKEFGLDLMDETPYEETTSHLSNGDLFWVGLFRRDITNMETEKKDQKKSSDVCGYYNKTLGYVINLPWEDCQKTKLPFICVKDDESTTMATPSKNVATRTTSRPVVGIIIGAIVMVLAITIIIVIIVTVYCRKSRQSKSSDLIPVQQETPKNPKPINTHPNYSIVTLNPDRRGHDDGGTYADLYRGEYDVLYKQRKRNDDNNKDNIYNHATNSGEEEDMYDHTQHVDSDKTDDDTYNHTPRNYTNKGFHFEDDYHRIIKV